MAIIGEMRNLTIGGKTYTIPGYTLPIASASTLGGVRIGSGLAIESGTGILSVTNATVTETDPVFSASAAAVITSTDISNWNAKVSDDKTWNGITLSSGGISSTGVYIPAMVSTSATTAYKLLATPTPTAQKIVQYDSNAYLYSTTPSANDNSTKVATTAYVDAAIPNTSGFVSKSGDTMTGDLEFTNWKGVKFSSGSYNVTLKANSFNQNNPHLIGFSSEIKLQNIATPSANTDAANKKYVDDSIPKVYSSTNTSGYLTMATLPIYDGTVE